MRSTGALDAPEPPSTSLGASASMPALSRQPSETTPPIPKPEMTPSGVVICRGRPLPKRPQQVNPPKIVNSKIAAYNRLMKTLESEKEDELRKLDELECSLGKDERAKKKAVDFIYTASGDAIVLTAPNHDNMEPLAYTVAGSVKGGKQTRKPPTKAERIAAYNKLRASHAIWESEMQSSQARTTFVSTGDVQPPLEDIITLQPGVRFTTLEQTVGAPAADGGGKAGKQRAKPLPRKTK